MFSEFPIIYYGIPRSGCGGRSDEHHAEETRRSRFTTFVIRVRAPTSLPVTTCLRTPGAVFDEWLATCEFSIDISDLAELFGESALFSRGCVMVPTKATGYWRSSCTPAAPQVSPKVPAHTLILVMEMRQTCHRLFDILDESRSLVTLPLPFQSLRPNFVQPDRRLK